MPSSYDMGSLPTPNDSGVILQKTSDEYVAVLKFKGYASDKDIKSYSEKLANLLTEKGITFTGNFRYLGYNPPYQFIGRRNEIIVSVNWSEDNQDWSTSAILLSYDILSCFLFLQKIVCEIGTYIVQDIIK